MRAYNKIGYVGLVAAWVFLLSVICGCEQVDPTKGYSSRSLYRTDVKTVFVEEFESESFRRGVEFELSRAVAQQLELHSAFKVISDRRQADSVLYGSIKSISEKVLAQQRELDRPIANEVLISAAVTWKDLRSGELLLDGRKVKVSGTYVVMQGAGRNKATQEAVNDLAVRIVEAMEEPW